MTESSRTRVPPNDLSAERSVLGGILLENGAFDSVVDTLSAEAFYSEAHGLIYEAMLELSRIGQPIDTVTLRDHLATARKLQSVGGDEYLLSLTNTIPTVANIKAHAAIVREKSVVRKMIAVAHEIASSGYADYGELETYLDHAEGLIFQVAKQRLSQPYEHIHEVVQRTFQRITDAAARGERITGVATGFSKLDHMTAGMHPGDLIIVAGRPGMGKTAFAMNVATNACRSREERVPVVVFSLEMPAEQLVQRMLCSEALLDASSLRTGRIPKDGWPKFAQAAGVLADLPIWIDDSPALTVMELRSKARRLKAESGLGLIVVDYLQLMRAGIRTDNRQEEISEITRQLKVLAKELAIPVIALAQLNRGVESRAGKDKRPQLSDLRESGAIEQDADTILFIYREEMYNRDDPALEGVAEVIIGKQRQGPTGTVRCRFSREYTRFDDVVDDTSGHGGYE
jgi:replicative DNA helicase